MNEQYFRIRIIKLEDKYDSEPKCATWGRLLSPHKRGAAVVINEVSNNFLRLDLTWIFI